MTCPMCQGTGKITIVKCENDNGRAMGKGYEVRDCPLKCQVSVKSTVRTGNSRLSGNEKKLSDFNRPEKKDSDSDGYSLTGKKISIRDWYGLN